MLVIKKTFGGTTKKGENINLSSFLFQYNFLKSIGREGLKPELDYA